MEVLSQEELEAIPLAVKDYGKGTNTTLLEILLELEVGSGVEVKKEEYHLKTGPGPFISKYFKNKDRQFKTRRRLDGTGWVVIRIE